MVKAAISGFGRIGRTTLRVWLGRPDLQSQLEIVAINTSGSMPISGWAHLLKYDTAYGCLDSLVSTEGDNLVIAPKHSIPVLAQKDPAQIPWNQYGVEVVIEATGVFRDAQTASLHLKSGAKKVIISAPGKGEGIGTYVLGANKYQGQEDIIDNASCTTNCIAPVVAILQDQFGIAKAAMTTIHSYTDDQNLQDGSHKDLRRARSAAQNIIPTSTGAARATTKAIPKLSGLFDGISLRVPTITGSISDITCLVKQKTTVEAVNQAFKKATDNPVWKNIVAVTSEPLVSSDIIGRPESAIIDLSLTQVIDGDLVKVFAWYDNEWGYCNRLLEQAINAGKTI